MRFLIFILFIGTFAFGAEPSVRTSDSKFPTVEEALKLAFPKCELERSSIFLTKEQKKSAEKLAGGKIDSRLLLAFTATQKKPGQKPTLMGWGYVDSHKVRAKKETLLILVNPDNALRRLEVVAFGEPREYIPRELWYAQFKGKKLTKELRVGRDIRSVSGATLTAAATTAAVRRVLAIHKIIGPPTVKTDK
ncbi:MAG: electron transport complex protein RnfG [Planctomycetota bacterium]|jgi:electron transport complex protein RnfG